MGLANEHVHALLAQYAEQCLGPAERARLEQHLAHCSACRAEAAETLQLVDALQAMPAALRLLPRHSAQTWPALWTRVGRVGGSPVRKLVPQLSVYLSLVMIVFVAVASLPAGHAGRGQPVTAGMVQTPLASVRTAAAPGAATPLVDLSTSLHGAVAGAATHDLPATAARPIPIPTPIPGPGG